jgi:hypothetical protein
MVHVGRLGAVALVGVVLSYKRWRLRVVAVKMPVMAFRLAPHAGAMVAAVLRSVMEAVLRSVMEVSPMVKTVMEVAVAVVAVVALGTVVVVAAAALAGSVAVTVVV